MPAKPVPPEFDPETNEPLLNWTKTSNRMLELFTQKKITGDVQFAALLRIAKETWGHLPKRPWMRLVVSKEAERLNCSRQALINALKDAEERNLIESKKDDTGKNRGQLFRLTNWKDVLDRRKPDKKSKRDETDITADSRNTIVLLPGRSGTISIELMVNSQLAKIQVECHNTLSQRATFQGAAGADGKLVFTIDQPRSGEKSKAETGRTNGVQSVKSTLNSFVDNKEVNSNSDTKYPNGNHLISPPVSAPVPQPSHSRPTAVPLPENPAHREFESFVTQLRQDVWGVSTDPEFLRRIVEEIGDTPTPAEALERRLIVRFGKAYGRPLSREKTGLLLDIARDARKDNKAAQEKRKAIPETQSMNDEEWRKLLDSERQSMSDEEWRKLLDSLPPEDRADLERRQAAKPAQARNASA